MSRRCLRTLEGESPMAWSHARSSALELIVQLPPIPHPWSISELCQRLAQRRDRALLVQPSGAASAAVWLVV